MEEKRQKVALTRIISGVQAKVGPGIRSAAVANLGQLGAKNIKAEPKLSPSDGARFDPQFDQTKAMTMYPWLNFALAQAPPHRPPLCLNMDETALIRHLTGLRAMWQKYPALIALLLISHPWRIEDAT